MEFLGVAESDVYGTLQILFGGISVGYAHRGEGRNPIKNRGAVTQSGPAWSEAMASTPVPANTLPGNRSVVELGEVVCVRKEDGSPVISRRDGRFADIVIAELAGPYDAPNLWPCWRFPADRWARLAQTAVPSWADVLVVAQFGSFRLPLVILTPTRPRRSY